MVSHYKLSRLFRIAHPQFKPPYDIEHDNTYPTAIEHILRPHPANMVHCFPVITIMELISSHYQLIPWKPGGTHWNSLPGFHWEQSGTDFQVLKSSMPQVSSWLPTGTHWKPLPGTGWDSMETSSWKSAIGNQWDTLGMTGTYLLGSHTRSTSLEARNSKDVGH